MTIFHTCTHVHVWLRRHAVGASARHFSPPASPSQPRRAVLVATSTSSAVRSPVYSGDSHRFVNFANMRRYFNPSHLLTPLVNSTTKRPRGRPRPTSILAGTRLATTVDASLHLRELQRNFAAQQGGDAQLRGQLLVPFMHGL